MNPGDVDTLAHYQHKAPSAALAHPTADHFEPLLLTLSAAEDTSTAHTTFDRSLFGNHTRSIHVDQPTRSTVMARIGVILGSTRPGRTGAQVADWVMEHARRSDATLELMDRADYPLPHLDEPQPPQMGGYHNAHTHQWAAKIASYDGFIFITPEYNHSTSGVLKNAIDYLYGECNNKAMGVVSYGAVGGARAARTAA